MDAILNVDSNFVNQKYIPLYPDRTLEKNIKKLCSRLDRLTTYLETERFVNSLETAESTETKKMPFWYLVVGILFVFVIYFKTNLFNFINVASNV